MSLNELGLDELFSILDCDKIKELVAIFGERNVHQFIGESRKSRVLQHKFNRAIQSLAALINDAPRYPVIILWSVLNLINLGFITLTIITASIFLSTLGVGVLYFVANYLEMKKMEVKMERLFQLIELKDKVADLILEKEGIIQEKLLKPQFKDKRRLTRIRDAVGLILFTTSTLFGTFFLGANAIVAAFGASVLAAALTGPIGLLGALGLFLVVGMYFGINYYQMSKREDEWKFEQKQLLNALHKKTKLCHRIRTSHCQLERINIAEESNEPSQSFSKSSNKSGTEFSEKTKYSLPFFGRRMMVGPNFLVNPGSTKLRM
ncbi:hypothetical protein [Legionella brunensis]|uniref:Uncharacterized protein n=1 Tax=Legionella brunensis TaxID=29422 RepID=A0A0W0SPC9_9GAMM|nr:hypothetical protein [Legionella brunensis]KTC85116.1 hypothetical protein Lbru_0912 [Legionella brunensis]